jgi:Acetyltransferase (GNAT) domain
MIKEAYEAYKPVFFCPGWASEKYYGWRCVHEEEGVRVIRKAFGMLHKTLFMCQAVDDQLLSVLVNDPRFISATGIEVIHDFSRSPCEDGLNLGGRQFAYTQTDRMLNVGTFVINLDKDEEELLGNLEPNSRNKMRKAIKCGAHVRISSQLCQEDLGSFFDFYRPLAARVGLDIPEKKLVERMIRAGDMITASALASNSSVVAVNLIYLCPPYAVEVWAASASDRITGAGNLLKWECMRWLKQRGLKWYDFGGVASTDPGDPIYVFKKTFGARYVNLGSEYRRIGGAVKPVYALFRQAKELIRRSRVGHTSTPIP